MNPYEGPSGIALPSPLARRFSVRFAHIRRTPFYNLAKLTTKKDLHFGRSFFVEGPVGFEPTTRGLKGHCSNRLSYGPSSSRTPMSRPPEAELRPKATVLLSKFHSVACDSLDWNFVGLLFSLPLQPACREINSLHYRYFGPKVNLLSHELTVLVRVRPSLNAIGRLFRRWWSAGTDRGSRSCH